MTASSSLEAGADFPSSSTWRMILPSPAAILRGCVIGSRGAKTLLLAPSNVGTTSCLSFSVLWVSLNGDPDCCLCQRLANIVNGRPLSKTVFANGTVTSGPLAPSPVANLGSGIVMDGCTAELPTCGVELPLHRLGSIDARLPCMTERPSRTLWRPSGQGIPSTAALRTLISCPCWLAVSGPEV